MNAPLLRQVPEEFDQLRAIYRELAPKRILEIGVWNGGTLWEWVTNAPAGATIVAVDYFEEDVPRATRDECVSWRDDVTVVPISGDSTVVNTVAAVRTFAPFDFVFIDGAHDYASAGEDWRNYGGMVEDGIVVFHDVAPHSRPGYASEVDRLWRQIRDSGPYRTDQIIASPPQGWAGIGIVYIGRNE